MRAGADRVCGGQGRDVVVNQDERSLLFGQCRRGQHENGDEQGCEAVHFPRKLPHFGVEWNGFPAIRSLPGAASPARAWIRSEEHTSELQSLMRISYAVFCLTK